MMTSCFRPAPYIKAYILTAFILFPTISQLPNAIADDDKNLTAAEHLQKAKELHKAYEKALWSGSWGAEKQRATKDMIRYYFREAAAKGNGEAFYELARRTTDTGQQINLYSEAIRAGFREGENPALKELLDMLFFDPRDSRLVDPSMGLELHDLAVKNGSSPIEQEKLEVLKKAAEVPNFNLAGFLEQIGEKYSASPYSMWWIVEKVSDGHYPVRPTPELLLQLVITLDGTSLEKRWLVKDFYEAWVTQDLLRLDGCKYAFSNLLMRICGAQELEKAKQKQKAETLSATNDRFSNDSQLQELAEEAYQATVSFVEKTARTEPLYDGSLAWSFVQRDIKNRLAAYKLRLGRIARATSNNGGPKGVAFDENMSLDDLIHILELNEAKALNLLESCSDEMISTGHMSITRSELLENQEAWRVFSEVNSKLFASLNREYDESYWKKYLASNRVRDLEQLHSELIWLSENYGC